MDHICFNGDMLPADRPVLGASNKSYRYGDGLFETMKLVKGKICLENYHFDRLFSSCQLMGYKLSPAFTKERIREDILSLSRKNNCYSLARIRLSVFPGNGGLYDAGDELQYLVECWPLNPSLNRLNEEGIRIGIYTAAKKSVDPFSNIKSANFLPYAMAARYAQQSGLDDCLVLNVHERVADATVANVFLISNGTLITPPLSEGCINGVMRRYLLRELREGSMKLHVEERPVRQEDLLSAGELFLTNAVHGIKWVGQVQDKKFTNTIVTQIYQRLVQTIFG